MSTREEVAMWTNLTEPRIRVRYLVSWMVLKDLMMFINLKRFGSRTVEPSGAREKDMQQ